MFFFPELLALKTKNAELIKAYAKLTHDYYELNRESLKLRRDLVELQAQHQVGYYIKHKP